MDLKNIKDRKNNGLDKEMYRHIDFMVVEELHDFVLESLSRFGTVEKLEEANKVGDVLLALLKRRNLLGDHTHQAFVDILIAATLVHNLFYDEEDWVTIFHTRRDLTPIAIESKVNGQMAEALFSTVEGQLGDQMPVVECIPKPNTPTEIFAYAIWFVKYNPHK